MARNIRNIGITAYSVNYGVVENGKLQQFTSTVDSKSPRKVTKAIAEAHGVDSSAVVIISMEEKTTNYRITDMVKAVELLTRNGLAFEVEEEEEEEKE